MQRAQHVAVLRKKLHGFGHGEGQRVGHGEGAAGALYGHLQRFGPVAAAVAVGAAQVDVGEKLHLHMLEAAAAAGGAAAVAAVEGKAGGGVAALFGQVGGGKELADGIPRADVAGRVAARGFAYGRLVNKHAAGQLLCAQQGVVRAGRFGGLAEVAQQRGGQHVLNQRAFAAAAYAGDDDQPLQGKLHLQILQVVLARALQNEPKGAGLHGAGRA